MSIVIKFQEEEKSTVMEVSLESTVKDILMKYLEMTNSPLDLSTDRITFMYMGKILNHGNCLFKKLSTFKIRNGATIRVIKTHPLGGPV